MSAPATTTTDTRARMFTVGMRAGLSGHQPHALVREYLRGYRAGRARRANTTAIDAARMLRDD